MTPDDRIDIDPAILPPPPDLVPGSAPPPTPQPNTPLRRKATQYDGSPITDRNEPEPGTFEPQDDTPEVLKTHEGPKPV